jgi:hypothetical protein
MSSLYGTEQYRAEAVDESGALGRSASGDLDDGMCGHTRSPSLQCFLKLGSIGFGGPVALVGYMHPATVLPAWPNPPMILADCRRSLRSLAFRTDELSAAQADSPHTVGIADSPAGMREHTAPLEETIDETPACLVRVIRARACFAAFDRMDPQPRHDLCNSAGGRHAA